MILVPAILTSGKEVNIISDFIAQCKYRDNNRNLSYVNRAPKVRHAAMLCQENIRPRFLKEYRAKM